MLLDEDKPKEQLINELVQMRQRVADLKIVETERKWAEEALLRHKDLLNETGKMAKVGGWEFDIETQKQTWAEEVYRIHELDMDYQPTVEKGISFYAPEAVPIISKAIQRAIEYSEPFDLELPFITAKGNRLWVHAIGKAYHKDGKTIKVGGTFQDITERKQAMRVLGESEEKYRSLFESMLEGFAYCKILVDEDNQPIDFVHLEVNNAWERLIGLKREDVIGKKVTEAIPGIKESKIDLISIYGKVALTGEQVRFELYFEPLEQWFNVSVYSPQKGYFITVFEDITECKRAEEELRYSRDYLERLTNSMWDAVFSVKIPDRVIEWANDSFRLIGYEPEECIGKTTEFLYQDKSEFLDFGNKLKNAISAGKGILHTEQLLKRKSGELFPAEITATIFREEGKVVRATSIIRDITERKKAEEREKQLQQELYLSSRLAAIGELAAGVAHEINNPLTGIVGFSERLLRKSTDENIKRDLERIHSEALRAAKVIENLQTFARPREPEKEYSDINEILQKALELRAYELKASSIEIEVNLTPSLPKTIVDFQQIQDVFLNIILNAEQAMIEANGKGELTIKTEERKGYIRVSFADDGPGIATEHLNKVFDPFFTTRGERGGTGLGLSVCHGIVTEHGGRIYAKSKPGKGATFFVELPCP